MTADRALAPCDSVVAPSYVLRDAPDDFDRLGTTLAVRAGWIYAGAPDAGGGAATDRGLVVAFEQVGAGWSERFTIERPGGPENGARFGDALATKGDVLAVGCPREDAATTSNSGRVHLFQPGTTSATLLATLEKPGGPQPGDTFGASVALAFDVAADEYLLLVGTPLDDGAASNAGRADLFVAAATDLTAWTHVHTFVAPSASAGDEFGSAVALTPDHVVIGAPFSEEAGPSDAGVAYLFARNPDGTWPASATRLVSPDPPTYGGGLPGARFGTTVAIDGDTIAVGAPRGRIQTQNCGTGTKPSLGTVDVFVREGTLWLHQEQIIGSGDCATEQEGARFGEAIDLVGDDLVVGAARLGETEPGFAYRFARVGRVWVEVERITDLATDPFNWTQAPSIGAAVAIGEDGSTGARLLVAGAPNRTDDVSFTFEPGGTIVRAFTEAAPSDDCDEDGVSDACAIAQHPELDCNENGVLDACEIGDGLIADGNADGIPDACDPDCDENGIPDWQDLLVAGADCDEDGVLDACQIAGTVEIVWVIDTSGSGADEADTICDLVGEVTGLLEAPGLPGFRVTTLAAGISPEQGSFTCLPTRQPTVGERYGTAIPLPAACCVSLQGNTENWSGAAAIVADRHPWQEVLRIVIVISDECGWNGSDPSCTDGDVAAVEAAVDVFRCRGVQAFGVLGFIDAGEDPTDPRSQLQDLSEPTDGRYFELDSVPAVTANEIFQAIQLRRLRFDADQDGILDRCAGFGLPGGTDLIDCNDNGIDDDHEIAVDLDDGAGPVRRLDRGVGDPPVGDPNGRIDLCEGPCPLLGDMNGDGLVGFQDLTQLLTDWGPCTACPSDLNGDGITGFADLTILLTGWGWCPQPVLPCDFRRGVALEAPQSIWDCYQKAGGDPQKTADCIEAMLLNGTP